MRCKQVTSDLMSHKRPLHQNQGTKPVSRWFSVMTLGPMVHQSNSRHHAPIAGNRPWSLIWLSSHFTSSLPWVQKRLHTGVRTEGPCLARPCPALPCSAAPGLEERKERKNTRGVGRSPSFTPRLERGSFIVSLNESRGPSTELAEIEHFHWLKSVSTKDGTMKKQKKTRRSRAP